MFTFFGAHVAWENENAQKYTYKWDLHKKCRSRFFSARVAWENFEKIAKITKLESM